MGLPPPEGMGETDRVCSKCLKKIHDEEIKRIRHEQLKRKMKKDLITNAREELKSGIQNN